MVLTPRENPNNLSHLPPRERVRVLMKRALPDIYKNPRFSFLSEYREILGEDVEILGEGAFGVIVQSPDFGVGVKVMKHPEERKHAAREFQTQEKFIEILGHLQVGRTPKYFAIPDVPFQSKKYGGLPSVSVVEGNSLLSIYLKKKFRVQFQTFFRYFGWKEEEIEQTIIDLKDFEVTTLLQSMGVDNDEILLSVGDRIYVSGLPEVLGKKGRRFIGDSPLPGQQVGASFIERAQRFIEDLFKEDERPLVGGTIRAAGFKKTSAEKLLQEIRRLDIDMKRLGYDHNDLSIGNIMIGKDGKVYIIDFGNSVISTY